MPVGYMKLHIFDQFPLMIPLDIRGQVMIGLNMHWIPAPLRLKTIQFILELRNKCINERMFRLWYRMIKYNPALSFMKLAVRKYYISHCSNVRIIPPDQWDSLPMVAYTLYRARFMQKSVYNPQQHIVRPKGGRYKPKGFYKT